MRDSWLELRPRQLSRDPSSSWANCYLDKLFLPLRPAILKVKWSLRDMKIIGYYSFEINLTVLSFSWGIFSNGTHLDQTRAKIFNGL